MDKATYDAFRILLVGYYADGGTLENALEAVRAAWLDHQEMEKREAQIRESAGNVDVDYAKRAGSGGGSK